MKTSIKASLIATAIAAIPFGSHAAGLGSIQVFSGLGQPLRAEIELSATPQELQSLTARIAPADAFRQANVSYSSAVAGVRVAVETRGKRSVVRLSSDRPIDDPFVDLLVELNWASGRMIREYTFLLDPIELNAGTRMAAAPVAPPVAAARTAAPAPRAAARPSSGGGAEPAADRYQVQRGDTLRAIADRYRPQGTSLDQMLVALLRENPSAFDEGNINRLRAGAILTLPSEATLRAVEPAQARREVLAQSTDFEAYRNRLAGTVAARPAATEEAPSRSSSGTITARVEEDVRRAAQGDRVQVSGAASEAGAGAAGEAGRLARLQALEEEIAARDKALEEAQSRVAELEASIRDMQRLLQLRSQDLAQLQDQVVSKTQELLPATAGTPEDMSRAVAEMTPARMPDAEVAPLTVAAEQPAPAPRSEAASQPAAKPAPVAAAPTAPAPVQPLPEPSLFDTMMEDPTVLAGGSGILLMLLGYAGYKVRERRKAQAPAPETLAPLSELPPETNSVFGVTGGQSVDTGSSSVIHTDFSQSGLSAIDADEGVDPVAEADVYMAYGRDAQAEEILLDALKADSSRAAIFLKLLEIYAHRKDAKQFESVAADLYSRTSGEGAEWAKATEMGRRLDPDNPLYSTSPIDQVQAPATEVPPPEEAASPRRAGAVAGVAAGALAGVAAGRDETVVSFAGGGTSLADLDFTSSFPKAPPIVNEAAQFEAPSQLKDTSAASGGPKQGLSADQGATDKTAPAAALDALPQLDSSALDFDLGAELDPVADAASDSRAPGTASMPPAPSLISTQGLMLDLDLGGTDATEGKPLAGLGEFNNSMNETVVGTGTDLAGLSSSLDFDLGAEDAGDKTEPAMVFDMQATTLNAPELRADAPAASSDLDETTFDSSLLDFQFDLEAGASGKPGAPSLDLRGIDLELNASGGAAGMNGNGGEAVAAQDAAGQGSDLAPPAEDVAHEVDTKLELASAYEEMGDKEGARELVEEVLREGSVRQREAASRLLERLT